MDRETLELAARYAKDTDGHVADEMTRPDDPELWDEDPDLAARLAFAKCAKHWLAQHASGVVEGVPVFE